jgi:ankyrin repeat protein
VYCQVVSLRGCHPGRIRHALSESPEILDEMYKRTLREINLADWELAHRLLQCVAVASRPLRVDELAEFLSFEFKAGSIAKFHEGRRPEYPVDLVLSTCSTLLTPVNINGSVVIQFSHFSVKEFLTSTRLAEANDEILCRYHISMTPAHTLVAQACLGILLHLDEAITRDELENYPLAEYAARHWFEHARYKNVSEFTEDGMVQLFDPKKPHFSIWIWIYDPRYPLSDPERAEKPSPPEGTPLHYAAICGLQMIAKPLTVEHGDVDSRDFRDDLTPLHVASRYGYLEVVRNLVEQGADMAVHDKHRKTPLHVASEEGRLDVAQFLVEHGADATALDIDGRIPLHLASLCGHVEVTRFFIEHGVDPTTRAYDGRAPLHWASMGGPLDVVRFLVEHGAEVTARANDGRTSLYVASEEGNAKIARFLLEHGADAAVGPNDGGTPLHLVASYGYVEIARILIEYGADVSAQSKDGQHPLHRAASYGNLEISRLLVEHGADVKARDNDGWTPMHNASSCDGVQVARFLVEHGADATAQDNNGRTPWDEATTRGHVEFAQFLIEIGAYATDDDEDNRTPSDAEGEEEEVIEAERVPIEDIDTKIQANNGWSPLHVAAEQGNVEVVRILVEHGMDVTAKAGNGWTPLHVATEQGNVELVRFLVEHGAEPSAPANDGQTPLHLAEGVGNLELLRALVWQGTDTATETTVRPPLHDREYFYSFLAFCLVSGILSQTML